MSLSEANTRQKLIDPALEKAGWNLTNPDQAKIKIPVDGYDAAPWKNGVTDYFDALMIGLTATPVTFVDHNTFSAFHFVIPNLLNKYYISDFNYIQFK
ncbi:type I restriction endonuclease [Nostoc sp. 'Peltigera membranacea cyanobiont' 232]|uniref:type I restriction endonuclease n=1 Tax=Nostoc sp. 'Peltigera membranacea cyanobiont' 232 TaxID=2014531 RepID=UPI000B95C107|nr:type I restriction endonuclease [Nostoc sp. 'Peltigera membranacea cyanobiont' 232]MBD2513143.1 hypothetical protein [Desmonostoc muscorum FACHB-395]OYE00598.1 hypothetical protein CDG79_34200 [Nostoc sp. 'Peltigera membranacea cyanobiont' 232]